MRTSKLAIMGVKRCRAGLACALWIASILLLPSCQNEDHGPTPVPAYIDVLPAYITVNLGASVTLDATVKDAAGASLPDAAVTWVSSNTDVATVTPAGLVTGVGPGATQVTAHSGNIDGFATIIVQQPRPTSLRNRIVFMSDRGGNFEIYSVLPDGSGLENLTRTPSLQERYPTVSPDGARLAFTIDSNYCPPTVVVMNADGTGRTAIPSRIICGGSPLSWSPSGSWIALPFSPVTALVSPEGGLGITVDCLSGHAAGLDWSKDGTHFVYASSCTSRIVVASADSASENPITSPVAPTVDHHPDWSPDGTTVAFIRTTDPAASTDGIYKIGTDGQGLVRVSDHRASELAWSPDGSALAFRAGLDIFLMNPDGAQLRQVTPDSLFVTEGPSWSPDGRQIAFGAVSDVVSHDEEIFVINPDGSGLVNVSQNSTVDAQFVWGPP
jgi:Tol biopolymer transport system component